ncbi:hypothetical protein BO99DRAFT_141125 [Aspergillus violaceofuscus CBS 115571]|uniref:Uncharacterized protein n=1 Tax=Aspergillus violaceofuscus (strain CBS 115571) TaxID=1450538 RepID=A0A2V5H5A8_ASPV1|nr:hypothetical protein BO99DRAFT_141125 [Aspergillus violaceofuscus CBS 115571]
MSPEQNALSDRSLAKSQTQYSKTKGLQEITAPVASTLASCLQSGWVNQPTRPTLDRLIASIIHRTQSVPGAIPRYPKTPTPTPHPEERVSEREELHPAKTSSIPSNATTPPPPLPLPLPIIPIPPAATVQGKGTGLGSNNPNPARSAASPAARPCSSRTSFSAFDRIRGRNCWCWCCSCSCSCRARGVCCWFSGRESDGDGDGDRESESESAGERERERSENAGTGLCGCVCSCSCSCWLAVLGAGLKGTRCGLRGGVVRSGCLLGGFKWYLYCGLVMLVVVSVLVVVFPPLLLGEEGKCKRWKANGGGEAVVYSEASEAEEMDSGLEMGEEVGLVVVELSGEMVGEVEGVGRVVLFVVGLGVCWWWWWWYGYCDEEGGGSAKVVCRWRPGVCWVSLGADMIVVVVEVRGDIWIYGMSGIGLRWREESGSK